MIYRILIVEDDSTIADAMRRHLESWGVEAHCVQDFSRVKQEFDTYAPHLVVLDIHLPFFNGYHWCQEIRKTSEVPILFVTSAADDMNTILTLQMGADDCIGKPFRLEILSAKIQALLRRTYHFAPVQPELSYNGVKLRVEEACLLYEEQKIPLTKNECRILQTLMEHGGVVSRDTLMERLWETDSFVDENTLSVNVARLRKKLESIGLKGYIVTKKGVGYALA